MSPAGKAKLCAGLRERGDITNRLHELIMR